MNPDKNFSFNVLTSNLAFLRGRADKFSST